MSARIVALTITCQVNKENLNGHVVRAAQVRKLFCNDEPEAKDPPCIKLRPLTGLTRLLVD